MAGSAAAVILDLSPGLGARFFRYWNQALSAASGAAPGSVRLHYVLQIDAEDAAGFAQALRGAHPPGTACHQQAGELAAHCQRLDTVMQRVLLADGQVSLTLCVARHTRLLPELRLQADRVYCSTAWPWDRWTCKALARLCRWGAQLITDEPAGIPPRQVPAWAEAGFTIPQHLDPASSPACVYAPAWWGKHTRARQPGRRPGQVAVVGAGLAGASVARALAERGWRVSVFERGPEAASGASGLPAGLVVPHVSADDSPRSRLSRMGVRLMLAQLHRLLERGADWEPSGVLERLLDDPRPEACLWHAEAAWVRPAALVHAWLNHPLIRLHTGCSVACIHKHPEAPGQACWELRDAQGAPLLGQSSRFDLVVLSHALMPGLLLPGAQGLPTDPAPGNWQLDPTAHDQMQSCAPVYGTLSLGPCDVPLPPQFPAQPVNGHGSLIPAVPLNGVLHWMSGSTFENDAQAMQEVAGQQRANLRKLQALLPEVATCLEPAFEAAIAAGSQGTAAARHWQSSRCVSQDRMPLVGPIEDATSAGVWISAAMGARGLSFAALCAQLLVAELHGEPWPLPLTLARPLRSTRVRRKRGKPLAID